MPASVFHYYFINDLIKNDKYQDLISLSGQGPDPFFFYGYSLSKRKNKDEIRKFGTLLHHVDPWPIYSFMIKYASKDKKHRGFLLAFTRGFMYHYCLDRNLHPYIFYISGFSNKSEEKKYYSYKHAEVESAIDAMIKEKFNIDKKIPELLEVDEDKLKIISKMFYELANNVFQNKYVDELSYYYGVKDMMFTYKYLNSKFVNVFVKIFMKKHIANALSLPKSNDYVKYDLFNEAGNKWLNCVNGNIRFETVFDLIENAKHDAHLVDSIIMSKSQEKLNEKLQGFTKNIDHDGFPINSEKKFFDLKIK